MTYYIYHIPGKKIGVTRDLDKRVTEQQGYEPHEYEILEETTDIEEASYIERMLQEEFGYRVDEIPYNKLKFNKEENEMNINITEATTTFPCPANKLKGQLMDNLGMRWKTDHGTFGINKYSINWIMKNIQTSKYNDQRCYVYNKAFSRFYDNHQTHDVLGGNLEDAHMQDQYNGKCKSGALSPTGIQERCPDCDCVSQFDLIRDFEKYGSTLDDERRLKMKGLTKYLNDVQEELMDAVLYIQAARDELQDMSEEALIDRHRDEEAYI